MPFLSPNKEEKNPTIPWLNWTNKKKNPQQSTQIPLLFLAHLIKEQGAQCSLEEGCDALHTAAEEHEA